MKKVVVLAKVWVGVFLLSQLVYAELSTEQLDLVQKTLQESRSPKVFKKGYLVKFKDADRPYSVNEVLKKTGTPISMSPLSMDMMIKDLRSNPDVEYIEPNYYIEKLFPRQDYFKLIKDVDGLSQALSKARETDYSKEPRIKIAGKIPSELEIGDSFILNASRSYTLDDSEMTYRWVVSSSTEPASRTVSQTPVLSYKPKQRGTHRFTLTVSNDSFPDSGDMGGLKDLLKLIGGLQQRIYSEISFNVHVSEFETRIVADSEDPAIIYAQLGDVVQLNASLSRPHPKFVKRGILDHLWSIPDFGFFNLAAPYSQFRKFESTPYLPYVEFVPDALGGYVVMDQIRDEFGASQTAQVVVDVTKNENYKKLAYDANLSDELRESLYQHKIIKTFEAWKAADGMKKSQVVVAVIDTGVNFNHPDLNSNIWTNEKEAQGKTGVDDDSNGYVDDIHGWDFVHNDNSPFDDGHHGTHVAGIIGAVLENGGVVGVAPNVKIMPVKGLYGYGSGELLHLIDGIYYAADNGAHIINASWGGRMEELAESKALKEAILYAQNKGVLFVAASGNETLNNDQLPMMPASYDCDAIISVAATTASDDLAMFSNSGAQSVDVAAPGETIISTISWNPAEVSYESMSGTSMATPIVAGVAAFIKSLKPEITYKELKDIVLNSGDELRSLAGVTLTGRRVNLLKAVEALKQKMPHVQPKVEEKKPEVSASLVVM
ncbi:MAG: S8 family serine peptidase [Deltaproteobacteria bacterium]|nr:S8 family serine peptidase [Deltaproteobacteria bacterium]